MASQIVGAVITCEWPRDRTRLWVDRELNALQNGCVADLEGQFTDERGDTGRVTGDCYRGVICLGRAGKMGSDS